MSSWADVVAHGAVGAGHGRGIRYRGSPLHRTRATGRASRQDRHRRRCGSPARCRGARRPRRRRRALRPSGSVVRQRWDRARRADPRVHGCPLGSDHRHQPARCGERTAGGLPQHGRSPVRSDRSDGVGRRPRGAAVRRPVRDHQARVGRPRDRSAAGGGLARGEGQRRLPGCGRDPDPRSSARPRPPCDRNAARHRSPVSRRRRPAPGRRRPGREFGAEGGSSQSSHHRDAVECAAPLVRRPAVARARRGGSRRWWPGGSTNGWCAPRAEGAPAIGRASRSGLVRPGCRSAR